MRSQEQRTVAVDSGRSTANFDNPGPDGNAAYSSVLIVKYVSARRVATTRRLRVSIFALPVLLVGCDREGTARLEAVGTLEVIEVDVAPMVTARVVRVWVEEGATVRTGDTLATLTQSTLSADIDQRSARVKTAEAALRELRAGARRPELEKARAELRAAEAEATRTARDLDRLAELRREEAISEQQLDAARSSAATLANRRDAARETLRLLEQGARPERIAGAAADVDNARAALAGARATRSDLVLLAPVDGSVLGRHVETGEVIQAGTPVLTVGQTARPWVRVYVSQLVLPRVRVGAEVTATLDGMPEREFEGHVVSVNTKAEFTPRVALTEEERADLMFGVKIEFADTTGVLKPGLPVTVQFGASAPGEQARAERRSAGNGRRGGT